MRYFIIMFVFLLLSSAPGQIQAAESPLELEEVVVTASRVSEEIKNAPVSVNVVTTKELEKIKARNPEQYLTRVPGINSSDLGGESELTAIRIPTNFTNPYTIVLVDGIPTSSYGSGSAGQFREINSNSIARIEVIKGPASALYGSNAIGGVINVITKQPSAKPEAVITTEIGDYNQWRSGFSGSAAYENLSFNVNLNNISTDNWRDQNAEKKKGATLRVNYTPTEQSLLTLKTDYVTLSKEMTDTLTSDHFDANWQHSYHTFTNQDTDKFTPSLSYSYYLDDAEVRATVAYRALDEEKIPNYSIRKQGPNYVGKKDLTESEDFIAQLLYSKDFSFLESKFIAGLDTERGNNDSDSYNISVTKDSNYLYRYTSYTLGTLSTSYDIKTKVIAPYLQLQTSPCEKLRLSLGGRYDSTKYEVEDRLGLGKGGTRSFSQFSPKVGATYDFASNLNGFVSYSEGFVVPTISQLWTSRYPNNNLNPENAENYEIGVRSSFWNKRAAIDVSLYSMDISDKIVVNDTQTQYANAGESTQRGVEVITSFAPFDYARLTLAYTYARNKYDTYIDGGTNYSGNWQPRSPEHHINARLSLFPFDGFTMELEMDEISKQYANDANTQEYSRPTLFNLRTEYGWKNWSVWGHILNLRNTSYASYVSTSTTDGIKLYSGIPRTFYAGLTYRFGQE